MRDNPHIDGAAENTSGFHLLLQRLASEHDRELGHLRAEVAHLKDKRCEEHERELELLRCEVLQLQQVLQRRLQQGRDGESSNGASPSTAGKLAAEQLAASQLEGAAQRGRSMDVKPMGSCEMHEAPKQVDVKQLSPLRVCARGGSASPPPETFSLDHMAQGLEWEEALENSRKDQAASVIATSATRVQSASASATTGYIACASPGSSTKVTRSVSPVGHQWVPLSSNPGLRVIPPSGVLLSNLSSPVPLPGRPLLHSPPSTSIPGTPLLSSPAVSTRIGYAATPVVPHSPWHVHYYSTGSPCNVQTGSLRAPCEAPNFAQMGSLRAPVHGAGIAPNCDFTL